MMSAILQPADEVNKVSLSATHTFRRTDLEYSHGRVSKRESIRRLLSPVQELPERKVTTEWQINSIAKPV
jgi:hypothetical protein